jgi:multiple sugar transport system permease protein
MASRMLPLVVLMVPLYVMFRRYGLLNSLWDVIVAEIGLRIPHAVPPCSRRTSPRCRRSGKTRPGSTAARGSPLSCACSSPLATPGLAACGVILFVLSWHALLSPLIIVSQQELMTLPVVLAGLVSDYFVFFTLMTAICLLGLLPTVLLVLLRRKDIVRGLVAGALKGGPRRRCRCVEGSRGDSIRADRLRGLTLRARVEDRRTTAAAA